jgi:hypothetical protein
MLASVFSPLSTLFLRSLPNLVTCLTLSNWISSVPVTKVLSGFDIHIKILTTQGEMSISWWFNRMAGVEDPAY